MATEDAPFEDTDADADDWVDVRMTDPQEGEWDVDVVVVNGLVEYVDLRIRPALLAAFVDCLVDDVDDESAREALLRVAERQGIDVTLPTGEERDGPTGE